MLTAALIAAAIAFCADTPSATACQFSGEPARIEITVERRGLLEDIANTMARGYNPTREFGRGGTPNDVWSIDRHGDCEDRVLWALDNLGDMAASARPMMILERRDPTSSVRYAHIVLAIFTTEGMLVIDPRAGRIVGEPLGDLYLPEGSIAGQWRPVP